jgi:hypothetical protein
VHKAPGIYFAARAPAVASSTTTMFNSDLPANIFVGAVAARAASLSVRASGLVSIV